MSAKILRELCTYISRSYTAKDKCKDVLPVTKKRRKDISDEKRKI